MSVTALDHVLFQETKLAVVLVDVVLIHRVGQPTNDEEMAVTKPDPARTMEYLLRFVFGQQGQIVGIIDVDPRVGVAGRTLNFPQLTAT